MKNNTKNTSNASLKWDHKFNWGPFKPLEPKLKDAPIAISVNHNWLLLEDIMLLKTGENVLLLISSNNKIFKKKSGNALFLKNMS